MAFADRDPATIESVLQDLIHHFDYVSELGFQVHCWSEVWHLQSPSGREVHEAVYANEAIDRDLRTLFAIKLGRLPYWDKRTDEIGESEGIRISTTSFPLAPTAARAAQLYLEDRACCLVTSSIFGRSEWTDVVILPSGLPSKVFFLDDSTLRAKFWREVALIENFTSAQLAEIAGWAFPRLRFHVDVWGQTSRMEGSFINLRDPLVNNLGGLNDFAPEVWADNHNAFDIQVRMAALASVDCSLESSNTRKNVKAMRERDVQFDGATVRCEWHAKLEPHRNRIHFDVRGDRVLIGLFASHLTT